jgi:DNA polymerase III subunit epsilon
VRRRTWRDAHLLCVDVELTGLDPDSDQVIAYGAVPIVGGRILASGAIESMVKPNGGRRAGSVEIHGILPHDLDAAPEPADALAPLAQAMRGCTPIAHAAWVERAFLGPAMRRAGGKLPRGIIDTSMLWRLLCVVRDDHDPGYRTLASLTAALGLPSHKPHQALGDALTTAQVFLALATQLERHGHGSLSALVHADRRVAAFRQFPAARNS